MSKGILEDLSPPAKLIFVILLVIAGFILSFLLAVLLAIPLFHVNLFSNFTLLTDFSDPRAIGLLKYFQVVQSFGFFIVPALLAGWFFRKSPAAYLHLDRIAVPIVFLLVAGIMLASSPMINWMVSVNESMKLPSFLSGVEKWMQDSEDQAAQLTDSFLATTSIGGLALNLFMIAVLPAIGEEMLFRGLLQRLFAEWFRNIHVAILFTALIFGIIHLQFYGILPRVILGAMFGYMFYWSGSLWVPVLAHFLNNGAAVVISFLVSRGQADPSLEDIGTGGNGWLIISSFVITGAMMFWIWKNREKKVVLSHPKE
jgi:uncharacterized protein